MCLLDAALVLYITSGAAMGIIGVRLAKKVIANKKTNSKNKTELDEQNLSLEGD